VYAVDLDMPGIGKKLKTVLEGYAAFLRKRELVLGAAAPSAMGAGVSALCGGAWRLHVRADAGPAHVVAGV